MMCQRADSRCEVNGETILGVLPRNNKLTHDALMSMRQYFIGLGSPNDNAIRSSPFPADIYESLVVYLPSDVIVPCEV